MRRLAVSVALLAVATWFTPASAGKAKRASGSGTLDARPSTLDSASIVSRLADTRAPADASPKRARADQGVTLYAVVQVRQDGRTITYSDAGEVKLGGKVRKTRPLAELPGLTLRWAKVEPSVETMSNEASGSFAYERIPYVETDVAAWRDQGAVRADVRPTATPDRGGGLGTMRYKVTVGLAGQTRASAGVEAVRGGASGGLTDDVHRVSLRRDDSYLGWLTEMYGQPYIWASAGPSDRKHQSERLEGSDCADFVIYGWRRLGHDVAYTWTGGLPKVTRKLAAGTLAADGVYRDAKGQPLPFTRPGDLLLFPRHVGVLVRDAGTPGVLDQDDVMVHTLFASPHEQRLADSGYADRPVEIRRFTQ